MEERHAPPAIVHCPVLALAEPPEEEFRPFDLWRDIWRGKWLILAACLLAGAVSAYVAYLVLPKTYQAEATLQPAAQGESNALGRLLGNLPLPLNLGGAGGDSTKVQSIMNFLRSNTLAERLIVKHDLLPALYPRLWDPERKAWTVQDEDRPTLAKALQKRRLEQVFEAKHAKEASLVTLTWESRDPAQAAAMLQAVIQELKDYLDYEYVTDAKREREFVEKQLQESARELDFWEASIPSNALTQSKIAREQLAAQAVYAELRRQLALAQIAEAKDVVRFKTLDQPFPPELKHGPKRSLIIGGSVFGAAFLAALGLTIAAAAKREGRRTDRRTPAA